MDKIALLIPYFGKLPEFYNVWEVTAMYNETIDFYIFTDLDEIKSQENIHVIPMTFFRFREKLQRQFEFPIVCDTPYKLCDYKPVFGIAFQEMLRGYDWWGYCDIDLLLGDVRRFFNDDILRDHDRCHFPGHLSIYRNCDRMNSLYKLREGGYPALNYEAVFQSHESFYFDEARGMYTKCLLSQTPVFYESAFRDPLEKEGRFFYKNPAEDNQFVVFWKEGKCYSVDRNGKYTELLYAHFFRRKICVPQIPETVDSIKVVPGQVFFNSSVSPDDFAFAEKAAYGLRYFLRNLQNSIRRYGVARTVSRQKWSRDHDRYVRELEQKYK